MRAVGEPENEMNPREPQADDGAKPTRRDVAAHGALASTDLAYERLQQLFEISKLLTRYESLDRTLPAVLQLVAGTLSLRSSILLLRSAVPVRPRALVWHVAGADGERLATA